MVIVHNSDCVIGLKKPLNLEKNRRRTKPNQQAKPRPENEALESNARLKSGPDMQTYPYCVWRASGSQAIKGNLGEQITPLFPLCYKQTVTLEARWQPSNCVNAKH